MRTYNPGDPVVFRKSKASARPGPRAKAVAPSPAGELYSYLVDKYWLVVASQPDGKVTVRTRTGKTHIVDAGNPNLRRARWWERILFRRRFPKPEASQAAVNPS